MRAIFTIAGKDLKNLLTSPLFYIIAGLCSVLWSATYLRVLLSFAEQARSNMQFNPEGGGNLQREVFGAHIAMAHLLFIFVVPALTMRLLAEEKRLRTYDLLLTSPISATQIAIGKFLAGWGVISVLMLISFLYPLGTRLVADYPMAPLLSSYLGLGLVSGAYVAIGLFASSLTESLVLSLIMALVLNLLIWFIPQAATLDFLSPSVVNFFEYVSIGQHFYNFLLGAIRLKSLVFLGSLAGLFVFLTQRVVESSRWR